MDNTYKPIFPNKKIKTMKLSDDKNSYQEDRIYELFSSLEKNRFKGWINSPLKEKVFNDRGVYKGKYMYDNCDNVIIKKTYVVEFINKLVKFCESYGFKINNNKQFRDTVASYIYKLSK